MSCAAALKKYVSFEQGGMACYGLTEWYVVLPEAFFDLFIKLSSGCLRTEVLLQDLVIGVNFRSQRLRKLRLDGDSRRQRH